MVVFASRSVPSSCSVPHAASEPRPATNALSTECARRSIDCRSHHGQQVPIWLVHLKPGFEPFATGHRREFSKRRSPIQPNGLFSTSHPAPAWGIAAEAGVPGRRFASTAKTRKASRHDAEITEDAFDDPGRSIPVKPLYPPESTRQLRTGRAPTQIPGLPALTLASGSTAPSVHSLPCAHDQRLPDATKSSKGAP